MRIIVFRHGVRLKIMRNEGVKVMSKNKDSIGFINQFKDVIKSTYKCFSVNDAHFYNEGYIDAARNFDIITYSTLRDLGKYMEKCEHEENM